jgi:hypothetical protein
MKMKSEEKHIEKNAEYTWIDYSFAGTLSGLTAVLFYSVVKLVEMAG